MMSRRFNQCVAVSGHPVHQMMVNMNSCNVCCL